MTDLSGGPIINGRHEIPVKIVVDHYLVLRCAL